MNIVKKVISITSLTALIAAMSLNAAQQPEGSVNDDGQLIIGDLVIDPPAGDIDVDGNLVINGQTIVKPEATILEDGSLQVGDDTFEVPSVPVTAFLSELWRYNEDLDAYYSPWYGDFWTSEGNWIYWENFRHTNDGWMYIHTVAGSNDGFWAFHNFLDTWVYISNQAGAFVKKDDASELQTAAGIYVYGQGWGVYFEAENGEAYFSLGEMFERVR